jgi:hypothetical protein
VRRAAVAVGCVLAGLAAGGIWGNPLIGGVGGLVVGLMLAAVSGRRAAPAPTPPVDPEVESRLEARIERVAQRERALEQHAGLLAAREQDLDRRATELEEAAAAVPEPEPELEPESEPKPEPEPDLEPSPPPVGGWRLDELEALTHERAEAGASPAQQREWSTYLFLLREHAHADGTLPTSFDQLVGDVFGPLPQRGG